MNDIYIGREHLLVTSTISNRKINVKQPDQTSGHLDLTNSGSVSNTRARRSSTSNRLALEVAEEASISSSKSTRATESVQLASVAQIGTASSIGRGSRGTEELSSVAQKRGDDVLEDITLGNNHTTGSDVESVAGVGIPVVVDGVDQRVTTNLGAAARGVMDVVVLHGDEVGRASQVDSPVMVTVAGGRPAGRAIKLVVGEGHAVGCTIAGDEHLAANEGDLDVIYSNTS